MCTWRHIAILFLTTLVQANSDPNDRVESTFDDSQHMPGEPLSPQDYERAEALNLTFPNEGNHKDPIELAGLYEGDIIMNSKGSEPDEEDDDQSGGQKNAINKETQKWKGGVIPYLISSQFTDKDRSMIARAFLEYHYQTCIRFIARSEEEDYIHITRGQGCSSPVGKTGGAQQVTLGEGCVYPGIVMHELMHTVGFWHEQSRADRDDSVTILFQNISPGMEFNFKKYSWKDIQNLTAAYDTSSIMHYGPYAFSKDRKQPTIQPKTANPKMGQRTNFTSTDAFKIRKLYECDKEEAATHVPPTAKPHATEQPKCVDSHKFCPKWAEQGECKKNPSWMLVNCKKSCNQCGSPCTDSNKNCSTWEQKGECSKNPDYMHTYCSKSCGTCPNDSGDSYGAVKCEDNNKYCEYWASKDECTKNPKYMLKNCQKSCNSCKQGD